MPDLPSGHARAAELRGRHHYSAPVSQEQLKLTIMKPSHCILSLLVGLALTGCATYPPGPTLMVLPGSGSSFDRFRADEADCQRYAEQSIPFGSTQQSAQESGVSSAVAGAALGAAAGAAIGAASGSPGAGAAIGAGSGLVLGGVAGTDAYAASGAATQARYDNAYVQCMYAKGHNVPVPAGAVIERADLPSSAIANAPSLGFAPPGAPPADAGHPPPGVRAPPGY